METEANTHHIIKEIGWIGLLIIPIVAISFFFTSSLFRTPGKMDSPTPQAVIQKKPSLDQLKKAEPSNWAYTGLPFRQWQFIVLTSGLPKAIKAAPLAERAIVTHAVNNSYPVWKALVKAEYTYAHEQHLKTTLGTLSQSLENSPSYAALQRNYKWYRAASAHSGDRGQ